jgi:hypothetical protein
MEFPEGQRRTIAGEWAHTLAAAAREDDYELSEPTLAGRITAVVPPECRPVDSVMA